MIRHKENIIYSYTLFFKGYKTITYHEEDCKVKYVGKKEFRFSKNGRQETCVYLNDRIEIGK